jgi:4-hydroxybenzoate polyprenyltransferase
MNTRKTSPWLLLGRVSNVPTVWSNVLVGIALASDAAGGVSAAHALGLCVALSLLYVGGMYLNDAFDRDFDAQHRPERPIPSGAVSAHAVLALGFGMLAAGSALAGAIGWMRGEGASAAIRAVLLAGLIVIYDLWHKGNPLSPLLMGLCRVLVYATAGVAIARGAESKLVLPGIALLGYLIGLTYIAKHETGGGVVRLWPLLALLLPIGYGLSLPGALAKLLACVLALYGALTLPLVLSASRRNVPRAVAQLIAGISLLDAMVIAGSAAPQWAGFALCAFALTRVLQRVVPGT